MTKWTERYEENEVHSAIEDALQLVDSIVESNAEDSETLEDLNRIQQVLNLTKEKLAKIDPNLMALSTLNNLNKHITNIKNEMTAFQQNKTITHLQTANTHADSSLVQLSNLVPISTSSDIDNIRESVTSFRRSAAQNLRHLEKEIETRETKLQELSNKIAEASNEVASQKTRLDEAITQFQQQFSTAEEKRRNTFSELQSSKKNEIDESLQEYLSKFDEIISQNKDTVASLAKTFEDLTKKTEDDVRKSTEKLVEDIAKSKESAERLVHVIGNTGMVGGYQAVANQKRNAARMWKGVTFIALGGLIGFAIYAASLTTGSGVNWAAFSVRIFVATTFGIMAAYSARQGDRNDRLEIKHRKIELELASINPYLSDFPEEKQKEIKEHLAKKMFGSESDEVISEKDGNWNGTSTEIMKLLIKTFGDILKNK